MIVLQSNNLLTWIGIGLVFLSFMVIFWFILNKKLDYIIGGEGKGIMAWLSRNSARITLSALSTIFVMLILFSTNPPIKVALEPTSIEENLTFKDANTNFSKSYSITLNNFGHDLEGLSLYLDMSGCDASITSNKNRNYLRYAETAYLSFTLNVSPDINSGIYHGALQINASPVGYNTPIKIESIPIILRYTPAEEKNISVWSVPND